MTNTRAILAAQDELRAAQYHLDACQADDPAFITADHKREVAKAKRKLAKLQA